MSDTLVTTPLFTFLQLPLAVTIIIFGLAIPGGPLLIDVIPLPLCESGTVTGSTLLLTTTSLFALLWSL